MNLHDHQGGSSDNLRHIYRTANLRALRGIFGKSIKGRWTLRVVDVLRLDNGRPDRWRLVPASRPLDRSDKPT